MLIMKKRWLIISLLILLSFSLPAQANTISLLSSSSLTATPNDALLELEITAADQNKARLQNQFKSFLNSFKQELLENSTVTNSNFTLSRIKESSYSAETGYNNPRIHQKELTLTLTLSADDAEKIAELVTNIIDLIEDNNPSQQNVSYNSLDELELEYQEAYYYFKRTEKLQKELLQNALSRNQSKAQVLAELLTANSSNLTEIEEVKSANLANYQQRINLRNPQVPQKIDFKTKLRFFYRLD